MGIATKGRYMMGNTVKVDLKLAEEMGLSEEEFNEIKKLMGRDPNFTELGVFSAMWSEHCSYKNSRKLFKLFPTKGKQVLVGAGEENSGKLVSLVRKNAKELAEKENCELIINDGPPGIGCPVIASLSGVKAGIIVVEPTLSGIHDMERALELLNHFNIDSFVCINKHDINNENTEKIARYCESNNVEVVGKIPFDPIVTEALVAGKPILEYAPQSPVSEAIVKMWERTLTRLRD